MTRLRLCRGIALLAAALAAAPTAVCGEASSSKISARFLDSVEQAAPASIVEERPLAEIEGESDRIIDPSGQEQRRLSWWSFALQVGEFIIMRSSLAGGSCIRVSNFLDLLTAVHPPHPPPPKHHSGGSSGGSSSNSNSGGEHILCQIFSDWSSPLTDNTTSSYSGGNSGNTGYTTKKSMFAPGSLPFWMLIAAASAAAIAIAAAVIGSRRRGKGDYHPLRGSIERRMKLFGGMADGCYEGRELCGAQGEVDAGVDGSGIQEAEYKEMV